MSPETSSPVACIPNISGRARRQRWVGGVIALATAAVVVLALQRFGFAKPWRLIAFFPIFAGCVGVLQAQRSTCVALAASHARDLDGVRDHVTDVATHAQITRQAWGVLWRAGIAAVVLTALTQVG